MLAWFARGLAFERDMVRLLQEDAKKPRAERGFLGDFDKPRGECALKAQMIEDASEALQKYGERLDIRSDSLQRLFGEAGEVQVSRVRLIYEGGELMPKNDKLLKRAVDETKKAFPEVEVLFQ